MIFIEADISVSPVEPFRDVLVYLLAENGYESFENTDKGVKAYIRKDIFDESVLSGIIGDFNGMAAVTKVVSEIPETNWNEVWERNFDPVVVAGKCLVRAPFHNISEKYDYEILIEPKMAFGTAHHATTALMIELMLDMDFSNKKVLDMGCGTGILALLAEKEGAESVIAIDNDEWACKNSLEHIELNHCANIEVLSGDVHAIPSVHFDVVLANINKNILLQDIPAYSDVMKPGASLLLSGFYEDDLHDILQKTSRIKLQKLRYLTRDKWVAAHFIK